MNWASIYRSRLRSAEEAVALIQSGHRVYVAGNGAAPFALLRALAARASELHDVELIHGPIFGENPLSRPGMERHFRLNTFFVGSADREAVNSGRADYIPIHLHQIPRIFKSGQVPIDVALIHTSPPDEHGFLSYGVECLMTKAAAERARIVIAQVNPRMPRTLGDVFIHVSRLEALVEVDEPIPELERRPATDVELRIGRYVAELVDDGDTLQVGIGGIPDAVLAHLKDRRDLGVHSEMVSDGIMELLEAGVITGARKTLHTGKVVASFILSSQTMYAYVHNNPVFEFHPCDYTNDPFIIARNDRMVAINSALEIDLTGQVCADSLGTSIYSGFGGQVDFIRGAAAARGGKPVIALPSTAQGGTVSRIVPLLKPGAGVVTTRADVHYVVTEYGVAYLFGKNLRQRAEALIAIAHPAFREALERAAYERGLLRSR
ncbi:MAG: 4-hydroxybutyrate CoA-transferase [Acidobacteria bacterium]|nr:4-hydroxybutyrate CoA-transferase [Acidobacteriota bacterium]MDW7984464.1 acetyl-CoA hydrolase/transferase C-terminal domain-containing protein [Acidobacteriota bacterium]